MKVAWFGSGGAACAAVLAVLTSAPVEAADKSGVTTVAAEELDKRSKQAEEEQGEQKGMSDSAVRVLMTYAFSIIPEEVPGPDGKTVKTDKSDPKKYFIPTDDARRIIRAATRTAYAEVCGVPELGKANFDALMKGEQGRNWTPQQIEMINALHIFSVSYFTGNIKITTKEQPADQGAAANQNGSATAVAEGAEQGDTPADGDASTEVITAEAPSCPPEQKQKVMNAINAYVQAAQATSGKQ
ncbi:MAG: hypothetical protein R3D30_13475 [Hyphomicrobiales bacterium]